MAAGDSLFPELRRLFFFSFAHFAQCDCKMSCRSVLNTAYDTFAPHVVVDSAFWNDEECRAIESFCLLTVPWYRVEYVSQMHKNECTTPCWTSLYSHHAHGGIPDILREKIIAPCEKRLELAPGYFNIVLMRLYASGEDNIAYHSDDREFLEQKTMAIGSATFGFAKRTFSMYPVDDAWDTTIKDTSNIAKWDLHRGDFMAMLGRPTQLCWLHGVKPDSSCKTWRVNINLRRIRTDKPGSLHAGIKRFYKYCVFGDDKNENIHLELDYEQTPLGTPGVFPKSKSGITILNELYSGDVPETNEKKRPRQTSLFEIVAKSDAKKRKIV